MQFLMRLWMRSLLHLKQANKRNQYLPYHNKITETKRQRKNVTNNKRKKEYLQTKNSYSFSLLSKATMESKDSKMVSSKG